MVKDENYYNSLDKRSKEYKQYKLSQQTFTEDVGVGDIVDTITEKTGIKKLVKKIVGDDCGCDERKERWNKINLFKKDLEPRCLTDEEHEEYSDFFNTRTLKVLSPVKANGSIDNKHRVFVCDLYAKVFNKLHYEPCLNCDPKPLINMIHNLDKVYQNK